MKREPNWLRFDNFRIKTVRISADLMNFESIKAQFAHWSVESHTKRDPKMVNVNEFPSVCALCKQIGR